MNIQPETLAFAQQYIERQFNQHTWWPKAQPDQAKHEFLLMQHDPKALSIWCDTWLDAGQCKQLEQAITG